MGNAQGAHAAGTTPERTSRTRTVPGDWFLDPADPDAASRYQDPSALEDAATAFLDAAEATGSEDATAAASGPHRVIEAVFGGAAPMPAPPQNLVVTEDESMDAAKPGSVWVPLASLLGAEDEGEFSWQTEALCAQTDPEAFFPEKGGSTRDAKKVCASCTVRQECLEYALKNDERFGIWGGLSERERRRLRKRAN